MPVGAGFSTQRLYAQVPVDNLTDPDLEDAAIRYANGDDAGAEESLMAVTNLDQPRNAFVGLVMGRHPRHHVRAVYSL